jgi:alpha-amylase/alpha-mannosidase (GH57 family)
MWLPETAVDAETLEILSEFGIRFTVLSPFQAKRVRYGGSSRWTDVSHGTINPRQAYLVELPSGRSMSLFFYNSGISKAIAFERLLQTGDSFANRLVSAFDDKKSSSQLVNTATDGETYGHHHRFGEMALAYALHLLQSDPHTKLTIYGEFLEHHPPTSIVEIKQNSSWSCPHGVERWCSNCGCSTGGAAGWNQAWREPLRNALDWLRDSIAPGFEKELATYLRDPWEARDDYIEVLLSSSRETRQQFLKRHSLRSLNPAEEKQVMSLLELQRQTLMMYTSCGWFFNDISGIETIQILRYAGRAIELAEELLRTSFETSFLKRLSAARSNVPDEGTGRDVYQKWVPPAHS